jgi:peptide deformylase
MNREIIQDGDSRLKAPNKVVDDINNSNFKKIVGDLIDTMKINNLIGIAAPQIGENLRVFITEPRETETRTGEQIDELKVYINPKIIRFSEEEVIIWEGCGSYKKSTRFGPVKRPREITIEAKDLNGKRFTFTCDGILARVIQHEYDHLDGIEFVDRMDNLEELKSREYYIDKIKNQPKIIKDSIITKKEFKEL